MPKFSRFSAPAAALISLAAIGLAPAVAAPVKTVVLVHGAFADGSGWRAVSDRLEKDGYTVSIVQQPMTSLADDVAATKRVLDRQDGPVVLVGHSYGGAIITEAGADPKVKALVYIAALQPDKGESVGKLVMSMPGPSDDIHPSPDGFLFLDPAHFVADFCADLPKDQAAFMTESQMPVAAAAFGTPLTVAAWHDKPSFTLVTTSDHILSTDLQRFMAKRSGSTVVEVPSSHVAFASHPQETADLIERAAQRAGQ